MGVLYDSRAEVHYAARLELERKAGRISAWSRVNERFPLGGGLTYRPDFYVSLENGCRTELHEVKGKWTEAARMRMKLFVEKYPAERLRVFRPKLERGVYTFTEEEVPKCRSRGM